MDEILRSHFGDSEWPDEASSMYERVEVLGRGSFGVVWMARRIVPPVDKYDDEYVAIKNIEIKEAKSRIYAQREVQICSIWSPSEERLVCHWRGSSLVISLPLSVICTAVLSFIVTSNLLIVFWRIRNWLLRIFMNGLRMT
jgi:serine/threonine protein kinase